VSEQEEKKILGGAALIKTSDAYYTGGKKPGEEGYVAPMISGVAGEIMRYMFQAMKARNDEVQGVSPEDTKQESRRQFSIVQNNKPDDKLGGFESDCRRPNIAKQLRSILNQNAINFIRAPNEYTGAAIAAGYAEATGKTGVVAVTRGPGALGAIQQIHMANLYEQPLVILATTGPLEDLDTMSGWQHILYDKVFGSLAKEVIVSLPKGDKDRKGDLAGGDIVQDTMRALELANSGVKGPVVLVVPQDTMKQSAEFSEPQLSTPPPPAAAPEEEMKKALKKLENAKHPIILVGPGARHHMKEVREFAEAIQAPYFGTFNDVAPRIDDPYYGGDFGYMAPQKQTEKVLHKTKGADCVVVIGNQYMSRRQLLDFNDQLLSHDIIFIHEEALRDNKRIKEPAVGKSPVEVEELIGSIPATLNALTAKMPMRSLSNWRRDMHKLAQNAFRNPPHKNVNINGLLNPVHLFQAIQEATPSGTEIVSDGGGYMTFFGVVNGSVHPVSGGKECMGLATGELIGRMLAEKFKNPETKKKFVLVIGDSGFDMNGQNGLKLMNDLGMDVTVVLVNNRGDGAILNAEYTQGCANSAGYITDDNTRPQDYTAIAAAHGCYAKRVREAAVFEAAYAAAMHAGPGVKFIEALTPMEMPVLGSWVGRVIDSAAKTLQLGDHQYGLTA